MKIDNKFNELKSDLMANLMGSKKQFATEATKEAIIPYKQEIIKLDQRIILLENKSI